MQLFLTARLAMHIVVILVSGIDEGTYRLEQDRGVDMHGC